MPSECPCGSGLFPERHYDACGIYLCLACDKCESEKLAAYRPEILTGYTQEDVDEPIEAE